MKIRFAILMCVALVACDKKAETTSAPQSDDSLLMKPRVYHIDTVRPAYNPTGLVVDSLAMQGTEHNRLMARFNPKEVLTIYEDYRPLRKPDVTRETIDAFLKSHKITEPELRAILEEGDRLGWST